MYNTAILLREVSRNTCALIMMTRSPGCISPWPAVRVTISPGSAGPWIYAGLSHSISYNPWSSSAPSSNMSPERCHNLRKHSSFLHLISRNRHPIHSLSILPPPSLCLSFSLRRRLNALLWQLIHTFAVEEEKQSFWRKTLRALQTQS